MSKRSSRQSMFRRYPALIFIVAAGALAVLLPTALNVPTSGPSTLAEFAPVPGKGQGDSDLADLGAASSGGLGFGSGSGGAGGGGAPLQGLPSQRKLPRLKRCVGNPPRQTEDLRSPPCVALFEGDNGGATTRGVTGDEVTVVIHFGNVTGGASPRPAGFNDLAGPISEQDPDSERHAKAFAKYFNDRYQTYDRSVHFWGFRTSAASNDEVGYRASVSQLDSQKKTFALIPYNDLSAVTADEAAARKILGVTYLGFRRADYQKSPPYLISFSPDLEDQAASMSSYICTKLAGRKARHAPDPTLHERTREFGVFYSSDPARPQAAQLKDMLRGELQSRCGITPKIEVPVPVGPNYTSPVTQMRTADVTTVITVYGSGFSTNISVHAGAQSWYPEWIVGANVDSLNNDTAQSAWVHEPKVWKGAFGITYDYRRDSIANQPWYAAYREACSSCSGGGSPTARLYDELALLFYGIQAAGPKLTPQSLDKGMHAIPQRGSPDPYRPAAYFSPGNYSFIKDAMEIWWDNTSQAPGEKRPGCYRIPNDGARFRSRDWSGDDSQLFSEGPCQGVNQPPTGG